MSKIPYSELDRVDYLKHVKLLIESIDERLYFFKTLDGKGEEYLLALGAHESEE